MPRIAKRQADRVRQPAAPVQVTRVNDLAMEEALRLAGGDRARLRIVNQTTVVVLNRPDR